MADTTRTFTATALVGRGGGTMLSLPVAFTVPPGFVPHPTTRATMAGRVADWLVRSGWERVEIVALTPTASTPDAIALGPY